MPKRPKLPCNYSGCSNLIEAGQRYCDKHKKLEWKRYDERRGTATQRGYDSRWRKIRLMYLKENPLCNDCMENGIIKPAKEVHHVKALSDGGTHDFNNLMALCHECHSRRTATEQGFAKGRG